jgi:hypothetical protein
MALCITMAPVQHRTGSIPSWPDQNVMEEAYDQMLRVMTLSALCRHNVVLRADPPDSCGIHPERLSQTTE